MEADFRPDMTSGQLGIEAVDRAVVLAEEYCNYECQRIELTNQPRIAAIHAEITIHAEDVTDLEERLREACAQVFAGVGESLRERLKEIASGIAPPEPPAQAKSANTGS